MKKTTEVISTPTNLSSNALTAHAVLIGETPVDTGYVTKEVNGQQVECFEVSIDGTTITSFDKRLSEDLSVLFFSSNLDKITGLRKAIACFHLYDNDTFKLVSTDIKSFGEIAEKFNIKRDTAVAYAKVGKYFLAYDEETKDIAYKSDLLIGANLTNMQQMLSMVDEKSAEPLHIIDKYILKGDLHPTASLSKLKEEIGKIKSLVDYEGKKSDKKPDKKSDKKSDSKSDKPRTIAEITAELLTYAETVEDSEKKSEVVDLINRVAEMLTTN